MKNSIQNAASALGLPEPVLQNFMNLVSSLQIPRHIDAGEKSVLFAPTPIVPTARPFVDADTLLNSLIDEYDRKL